MKTLNFALLFLEILICLVILSGHKIAFGHGETDFFYFCLFYLSVIGHFVLTISSTIRHQTVKLQLIIFSLLTLFILSKATIFRGAEFPWDGDIFVNHGRQKPNKGNNIIYTVTSIFENKDSIIILNLPDPDKKYLTTLWVSDPECTGCNDCVIDSGKLLVPDTLKKFINDPISNNVLLLEGKSPYDIQGEPYISYKITGQVTGVKEGRLVFYVSDWTRR
jgi:hypothetical protein